MAKNKNNSPKNRSGSKNTSGSSKSNNSTTSKNSDQSMKDTHAQVPDNSPRRSGPGGE
jgi:hypothetical protein